jgi:very-short-patch-repair endonuclease
MSKRTQAQLLLAKHLKELDFAFIEFEYQFCPERKWRADIAAIYNANTYLFEADGGRFHGGHRRGKALEADYERQNWATLNGYKLLRFTNEQILTGEALEFLRKEL